MRPFRCRRTAVVLGVGLILAGAAGRSISAIPAWAVSAPSIVKAAMVDSNKDGQADEVVLSYSAKIKHTLQKKGTFPFSVEGYRITSVAAATGTKLVIHVAERSVSDVTVTPFVTYKGPAKIPVTSSSGKVQAQNQTFIGTTPVNAAAAIYVATTGNDANAGTRTAPKLTIQAAVAAAAATVPVPDVYVSAGTYDEGLGLTLHSGVNVDGGYTPGTWTRAHSATTTVTGAPAAALADGVTAVTLQLLTLSAQALPGPGSSAYGLLASNGASVTLQSVTIVAGDATAGAAGAAGATGATGADGDNGSGSAGGTGGSSGIGEAGGSGGGPVTGREAGNSGEDGSGPGGDGGFGGANGDVHRGVAVLRIAWRGGDGGRVRSERRQRVLGSGARSHGARLRPGPRCGRLRRHSRPWRRRWRERRRHDRGAAAVLHLL